MCKYMLKWCSSPCNSWMCLNTRYSAFSVIKMLNSCRKQMYQLFMVDNLSFSYFLLVMMPHLPSLTACHRLMFSRKLESWSEWIWKKITYWQVHPEREPFSGWKQDNTSKHTELQYNSLHLCVGMVHSVLACVLTMRHFLSSSQWLITLHLSITKILRSLWRADLIPMQISSFYF